MKRRLLTGRSFDEGMSPNVIMAPYFHFSFFFFALPFRNVDGFLSFCSVSDSKRKIKNKNKYQCSFSLYVSRKQKRDLLISLSQQVQKKRNEWF
jgi:hypothetical protein